MTKTWAIGDVHGCGEALAALVAAIGPGADYTLVFLGDVVDRGPDSRGVVDHMLDLSRRCRLVPILGNHEQMMLTALRDGMHLYTWLGAGGQAALDSYGGNPADVPTEHLDFLGTFVPYWYDEQTICVHANLEPGIALPQQNGGWLRWTRLTGREPRYSDEHRVIVGHTPQPSGLPLIFDGWAGIDTLAYGGEWLTALETSSGRFLQSNQAGEVREGQAW